MKSIRFSFEKLKRPKGLLLVITYAVTLLSVIGSLVMLALDFESSLGLSIIAYAAFAAAGISLGYSVYTVVIYSKGLKGRIITLLKGNEITAKMLSSFGFRTVVTASLSLLFSIAYAVFNGVLGIMLSSIWYGALAAYYLLLSITRGGLLLYQRNKNGNENRDEELFQAKKYRNAGIFLFILNIALSSAIAQMIFDNRTFVYRGWTIYAFAAYAFTKITMSLINLFRARGQEDLTIMGIRDINLIDAVVSILALQTALLNSFSTEKISTSAFNTATGIFVSLFSLFFSIYMICKAQIIIKQKQEN